MKKLMMIVLTSWALASGFAVHTAAASDEGAEKISSRNLAGVYAETVHGSYLLCVESTPPHAPVKCGSAGSVGVPITALAFGAYTSDVNGNACATWTETDSDSPVGLAQPTVYVVHQAGKFMSFDPTTGTGDGVFTNYFGGTCHGATFDSTGATVASSGTFHFVVSNHGKRIDTVVTVPTTPGDIIGGFSLSSTNLRE